MVFSKILNNKAYKMFLEGKIKMRKFVNLRDILIIVFVFVAAVIFWQYNTNKKDIGDFAVVELDGKIVEKLSLSENKIYSVKGKEAVVLEVRDGKCGFIQSDCADHVCINSGFLSASGQSAACLPNRVLLKIEKSTANGVDVVVG